MRSGTCWRSETTVGEPSCRELPSTPTRMLDVIVEEVADANRRRVLVPEIWAAQPWYAEQPFTLDEWVARAPMVTMREMTAEA